MNPFDLHGPEFLLFYFLLSAFFLTVMVFVRRTLESGSVPKLGELDPYAIAYLRGGASEALRVATISLIDRGLLRAQGETLHAKPNAKQLVRRPIEREILNQCTVSSSVSTMFSNQNLQSICNDFAMDLKRLGLIPNSVQIRNRILLGLLVLGILGSVGAFKIYVATVRHRHNIGFLNVLMILVFVFIFIALSAQRTVVGDRALQDLKVLFSGLKQRSYEIEPGGATNEFALLVAVFGFSALFGSMRMQAIQLFPKAANSSSSSTCGSSCGSSCGGSSCGGGCGGCGGGD